MVRRVIHSWPAIWVSFLAVALWWCLHLLPRATFWYEARAMIVADAPVGGDVVMAVDRTIHRDVFGEWAVIVRHQTERGWATYCAAEGATDYDPRATLPEPLTLSWWTDGGCTINDPGLYFVTTTWMFHPEWAVGARISTPLVSNTFRVVEVPEGE